jgi:hypothetical protein
MMLQALVPVAAKITCDWAANRGRGKTRSAIKDCYPCNKIFWYSRMGSIFCTTMLELRNLFSNKS